MTGRTHMHVGSCLPGVSAVAIAHAALLGIAAAAELHDEAIRGCRVRREGREVRITITDDGVRTGAVQVPRFHAPLRDVRWASVAGDTPTVQPEPRHWTVRWMPAASPAGDLILEFDEPPLLDRELQPALPAADGSFMLAACRAVVAGDTLRYEPQPHKNTVGFWTVATDVAAWEIEVAKAGTYAVAILQGCGTGQGGSTATLTVERDGETVARLPLTVTETGHFQNFRWFDIGTLTVSGTGRHRVTVSPERIAKAALGDIRSISLVPQATPPSTP